VECSLTPPGMQGGNVGPRVLGKQSMMHCKLGKWVNVGTLDGSMLLTGQGCALYVGCINTSWKTVLFV
jgi:hypothetical protein